MGLNLLVVAFGSAFGGCLRYLVSFFLNSAGGFPWGTLAVNVFGSLLIGALSGWLAHGGEQTAVIRLFAVVGVCGGFTTFSTFSNETFRMLESAHWGMAIGYVSLSLVAGLSAVGLGYWLAKI